MTPGVGETPSIGHIKARVHGGTDAPSNLRLEHITCNQRAGASDRAGFSLGFRSSRQTRAARLASGVPLDDTTWNNLIAAAESVGIDAGRANAFIA